MLGMLPQIRRTVYFARLCLPRTHFSDFGGEDGAVKFLKLTPPLPQIAHLLHLQRFPLLLWRRLPIIVKEIVGYSSL